MQDNGALSIERRYADELALVEERMKSEAWQHLEQIEDAIADLPQQELPLNHVFTPGLYTRQIFMPKGTLLTSRIHLTRHPFVVLSGVVSVWCDEDGWVTLRAPHLGVTEPGTRRILFIHEDCVWVTFHPTDETDPDTIVRRITYTRGKFNRLGIAAAQPALAGEVQRS